MIDSSNIEANLTSRAILASLFIPESYGARKLAAGVMKGTPVSESLEEVNEFESVKAQLYAKVGCLTINVIEKLRENNLPDEIEKVLWSSSASKNKLHRPAAVVAKTLEILSLRALRDTLDDFGFNLSDEFDKAAREYMLMADSKTNSKNDPGPNIKSINSLWSPGYKFLLGGTTSAVTRSVGMIFASCNEYPELWNNPILAAKNQAFLLAPMQVATIPNFLYTFAALIPQAGIDLAQLEIGGQSLNPDMWRWNTDLIGVSPDGALKLKPTLLEFKYLNYWKAPFNDKKHGVQFTKNRRDQLAETMRVISSLPELTGEELEQAFRVKPVVGCPISLSEKGFRPALDLHLFAASALEYVLSLPRSRVANPWR